MKFLEDFDALFTKIRANCSLPNPMKIICSFEAANSVYRWRRGRMIEVVKIVNREFDRAATDGMFNKNHGDTRANPYKLSAR